MIGTTSRGGANDLGTVLKIAAGTTTVQTLLTFNSDNGAMPVGALLADAAGNLFGTTSAGGVNNAGTVFELTDAGFVVSTAPEPTSLLMFTAAILTLAFGRRRWHN